MRNVQEERLCPIPTSAWLARWMNVLFPEPVTPMTAMRIGAFDPDTMITVVDRDGDGRLSVQDYFDRDI